MVYEWDEAKRTENLRKHGLDLVVADLVHEAPFKVTFASERQGEKRFIDLAEAGGVIVALVYTTRGGTIRCISMRRAKRKERRIYHAALENRSPHE